VLLTTNKFLVAAVIVAFIFVSPIAWASLFASNYDGRWELTTIETDLRLLIEIDGSELVAQDGCNGFSGDLDNSEAWLATVSTCSPDAGFGRVPGSYFNMLRSSEVERTGDVLVFTSAEGQLTYRRVRDLNDDRIELYPFGR